MAINERICIVCRRSRAKEKLVRLTVERTRGVVFLNQGGKGEQRVNGRSAYFCRSQTCFQTAVKGSYLKHALSGRRSKTKGQAPPIIWPLQSQLIKDIANLCTEPEKTCQNTSQKEQSKASSTYEQGQQDV